MVTKTRRVKSIINALIIILALDFMFMMKGKKIRGYSKVGNKYLSKSFPLSVTNTKLVIGNILASEAKRSRFNLFLDLIMYSNLLNATNIIIKIIANSIFSKRGKPNACLVKESAA